MNVIERARAEVLAGKEITSAVRHVRTEAEPWRALVDVLAELHGAGATIQPLLDDPSVTDVLINGDGGIWIDAGAGLTRANAQVDSRSLALRLATLAGRRLDQASPIVDGRLPDGTRLHAVLPPLVHGAAHISLRRPPRLRFDWRGLIEAQFLTDGLAEVILALIRTRANVLVSGGGGAGKTTLVAAALAHVAANERIVIIEEATELVPRHPHVVHLQGRGANVQGVGHVSLAELVRAAMRMRADRLVLGECRGAEVREMLAGFNTGHDGGWATIHANAASDVPARLIALGALAGMDLRTVELQALAGLDAVIHVSRSHGRRQVDHIGVVTADEGLSVQAALSRDPKDPIKLITGPGWQRLSSRLDQDL